MTRFVCPNCGGNIDFLSGVAVCLNPDCKLGHTLTPNQSTTNSTKDNEHEQPQTQVDPDKHHSELSPIRGDETDSGGGKS